MASEFGESTSEEPLSSSFSGSGSNDSGSFECNICFELAQDPIVTLCGHLFCWPCLYKWLHGHSHSQECPVCKAIVKVDKLVPLYGRGKNNADPRTKPVPGVDIPHRPAGQRPETAPPPDPNFFPYMNSMFMGGAPVASTRFANYTFSAFFGGLPSMLMSFHVHGFQDPSAYGPGAGFHYGHHPFHGGHAYGFRQHTSDGRQMDNILKVLLLLIGAFVVGSLVLF